MIVFISQRQIEDDKSIYMCNKSHSCISKMIRITQKVFENKKKKIWGENG